jgi:Domain of unknown function (DUF4397)
MRDLKIFKMWPLIGAAALGVMLSGCGGNGSSDNSSVRIANATITHSSIDLIANGASAITGTSADMISAYVTPSSGTNIFQLNDTGSGTALATTSPTLTGGQHYTLLAYESGNAVKSAILNEDIAAPVAGSVQLRLYNVAVDAGKIDVYVTDPSVVLTASSSPTFTFAQSATALSSGFLTLSPGNYRVRITGGGNINDMRLDSGTTPIVLTNQEVATYAVTPAAGGLLLNGSLIVQQGAYSATRNANIRVRLATGVASGTTVTLSSGTTTVGQGVAPSFTGYVLLPANSPLNVSSSTAGSIQISGTPAVGNDYTVLVSSANATATLLLDDNRPPTDGTVKMRFINGISGSVGLLSMSANGVTVGSNIAAGTASSYVSVASNTNATTLSLTQSLVGGVYAKNSDTVFSPNTSYTILIGGDFSNPAGTSFLIP